MVTFIRQAVHKISGRPYTDLIFALESVLPKSKVKLACKNGSVYDLIDNLAREASYNKSKLLSIISKKLGMGFAVDLQAPSNELISATGFLPEELESRFILPQFSQFSGTGYRLVVAHPKSVDRQQFSQAGVQVLLGSKKEIEYAWERWKQIQISSSFPTEIKKDVQNVILKIVKDCAELGAHEVFLGHPSDSSYEGITKGQRFSGFVHNKVFLQALEAVTRHGTLQLASQPPCRAALTRNFERPIVCLSWGSENLELVPENRNPENLDISELIETQCSELDQTSSEEQAIVQDLGSNLNKEISKEQILLVEDDNLFASVLLQILSSRGYEVSRACNGEEALKVLSESVPPALIISDLHMPILDGRELVRELKARNVPSSILMLTSEDDSLMEADWCYSAPMPTCEKVKIPEYYLPGYRTCYC